MGVKLKLDWRLNYLLILVFISFFIYSVLSFHYLTISDSAKVVFNSPDETANFYFAKLFANESALKFKEPANELANGLVAPRSMRVINGLTVPASFIGLPLMAGSLAKIFGQATIFFVVPFFACLGIIFFYLLVKELFNRDVALISSLLLIIQPAWWYYTTKSLMPNVLFVSLLIISLYFFIKASRTRMIVYYLLWGIVSGLMLMVRTSEISWLIFLLLFLIIIFRQQLSWWKLIISLILCWLVFSPVFYFNYQNYQAFFSFGYAVDLDLSGKDIFSQGLNIFEKVFLPFGFYPRTALKNLYDYSLKLFPVWLSISLISLIIFSLFVFLKRKKSLVIYLMLYLLISGYLIIYYGSWNFYDNPDPEATTIGISYIRYWLPIYVFVLPLVSYCLWLVYKKNKFNLYFVTVLLLIALSYLSFNHVFYGQDEGIFLVNQNLKKYRIIQRSVNRLIEDNAIIIAERLDKVFFPGQAVIFRLNSAENYLAVERLLTAGYPVYYFYFTRTAEELAHFNYLYWQPYQLEVQPALIEFSQQSLYPIKKINSNKNEEKIIF